MTIYELQRLRGILLLGDRTRPEVQAALIALTLLEDDLLRGHP